MSVAVLARVARAQELAEAVVAARERADAAIALVDARAVAGAVVVDVACHRAEAAGPVIARRQTPVVTVGLHVTALVIVKVERQPGWQDVASALSALPFVESVLAVSGDIDFVITVSAPDHESLSDVIMRQLHEVDGVASTRSYIVLESWNGTAPGIARDSWDA